MSDIQLDYDTKSIIFNFLSDDFATLYYLWLDDKIALRRYDFEKQNWNKISKLNNLPDMFYIDFKDHLNWEIISNMKMEDHDFLDRFKRFIPWKYISRNIYLTPDFLLKFEDLLDWDILSLCCDLPFTILETKKHKINWRYIKYNQNIPIYYLKHFLKYQFLRQGSLLI